MRKKRKIFLPVILLWFLGLGAWGYYLYTKPHENAKYLKADLTISAIDLYKQYAANETNADKKYMNKIIIVKGKISEIINNGATQIYLLDKQAGGGISCQIGAGAEQKKFALPQDSIVTIKGKCTGFLMDVNLVDCVMQEK